MQGLDTSLHFIGDVGFSPDGDLLVLHRVDHDDCVRAIAGRARARGIPLVYSTDDLLFSSALAYKAVQDAAVQERSVEGLSPSWQAAWGRAEAQRRTLDLCDCGLVTTEFLAQQIRRLGRPAYVLRNAQSLAMEAAARQQTGDRGQSGGRVMLGYLSGTGTHNHDLGDIADSLAHLMRRRRNVYLTIVGPMVVPECLTEWGTRVRHLPRVPWQHLPTLIAELDVNLAPLDMFQPFNHAKSELKWMEAGAVGVPTLASATAGFAEAVRHRETGLLASTPEEWDQALEDMVQDPALRADIGTAARREVEARYSAEARSLETLAVFEAMHQNYSRSPVPGSEAGAVEGSRETAPVTAPARSERRVVQFLSRGAGQAGKNIRRLLSPYYWDRVLRRWEDG